MADLRAGLVGYGQMGRHHARVLRALAGVELVAVADQRSVTDPSATGLEVLPSVAALIERGIDLAVVAAPTAVHLEIGLELAAAGVHTLIEKPVAGDVASALCLAEAFDRAGIVGCVGHIERYNPALQDLRRRLEAGELGDLFQVATRRQGPFPERISDVGVVMDLATHDIDLTSWVTQRTYLNVAARTAHRSGRQHEDLVSVTGSLEGGAVVSHLVNWLSPLKERVTVITGERGAFVADTIAADLTFFSNGLAPVKWDTLATFRGVVQGDIIRYAIPKPEPLVAKLEAFRDAVLGRSRRVVTIREAARTVAVAEAMILAADSGQTHIPGTGARPIPVNASFFR